MDIKLNRIQVLYDDICQRYDKQSVVVRWTSNEELDELDFKRFCGNYQEGSFYYPIPVITINKDNYSIRVIYHEILHHINKKLIDGPEFEIELDKFINEEFSKYF